MEDFITQIFCLVDDLYAAFVKKHGKLRVAGPAPSLCDSEVIIMLIVEEWLKHNEDKQIYRYFSQHWKVIGQLVNYFNFGRCRCRKPMQVARKLLAYTVGMFMQKKAGKSPAQLHDFVPVQNSHCAQISGIHTIQQ